MNKDKNETIEIKKATAWVALERLHDWLEYIEWLDDSTRRDVIALDDLIKALDAESFITEKREKQEAHRAAEWAKRKAEEEAKNKKKGKN